MGKQPKIRKTTKTVLRNCKVHGVTEYYEYSYGVVCVRCRIEKQRASPVAQKGKKEYYKRNKEILLKKAKVYAKRYKERDISRREEIFSIIKPIIQEFIDLYPVRKKRKPESFKRYINLSSVGESIEGVAGVIKHTSRASLIAYKQFQLSNVYAWRYRDKTKKYNSINKPKYSEIDQKYKDLLREESRGYGEDIIEEKELAFQELLNKYTSCQELYTTE